MLLDASVENISQMCIYLWGLLDFASLIYDIVADCSDNVPTRYLVNDACVLSGKPLVSASALRLEGQVMIKICICSGFQTFLYLALCVCSWLYITTMEAPATDVCTQYPHPQRQWPTVQMEGS